MTTEAVADHPPAAASAGLLDVRLVLDRAGRTCVGSLCQRFPQRVTVPMYLDDAAPGAASLCVQNPTGGVFPGDRLRTVVDAGPGTGLQLTGQSATQVLPGAGFASHDYRFTLGDGAVVEHLPRPTIPHRGARYRQTGRLALTGDAVFIGWDALAAGRIGHGERYEFDSYRSRTEITCDGEAVARENVVLEPARQDPTVPGVLGRHLYVASVLVLAPRRTDATAELVQLLVGDRAGAGGTARGVSTLPGEAGLIARVLADRAPDLRAALHVIWAAARRVVLGRAELPGRVGWT